MEISSGVRRLTLAETFTIARGTTLSEEVVWAEIRHDGHVGRGEGAPDDRYSESVDACRSFIDSAGDVLGDDPFALEAIEERLEDVDGEAAGKAALDAALHDWIGRRLGVPVWRLLGLSPEAPATSFTIGIDSLEGTRDRARRAREFRALKIKVGGAEDLARLEAVREESHVPLRVDANEGWTLEAASELMPELIRLGVEFVEQPFPAGDVDSFLALRELHPRLPVIVDEGCHDLSDVAPAAAYADGINVKLAKSGGVREAVRMIHAARALGLRVMIGCMVESQLGVAPAAAIASLADWVDLDGHLLLADQPFTGLRFEDGRVLPGMEAGLGVAPA
jgi:L-Ala-D/L-Glu epimerase